MGLILQRDPQTNMIRLEESEDPTLAMNHRAVVGILRHAIG